MVMAVVVGLVSALGGLATAFIASRSSASQRGSALNDRLYLRDSLKVTVAGPASDLDIVHLTDRIEHAGNEVLGVADIDTSSRRRTPFQLRQDLRDAGIWTTDDLAKFDRVLRQRNALVHGDKYDPVDLRSALLEANELLAALNATPDAE